MKCALKWNWWTKISQLQQLRTALRSIVIDAAVEPCSLSGTSPPAPAAMAHFSAHLISIVHLRAPFLLRSYPLSLSAYSTIFLSPLCSVLRMSSLSRHVVFGLPFYGLPDNASNFLAQCLNHFFSLCQQSVLLFSSQLQQVQHSSCNIQLFVLLDFTNKFLAGLQ